MNVAWSRMRDVTPKACLPWVGRLLDPKGEDTHMRNVACSRFAKSMVLFLREPVKKTGAGDWGRCTVLYP